MLSWSAASWTTTALVSCVSSARVLVTRSRYLPPTGSRRCRSCSTKRIAQGEACTSASAVSPSTSWDQAADVVLDAIARSDGTRSSVLTQLFATKVRSGLLGTFAFDPAGDVTRSPITILRAERRDGSHAAAG